MASVVSLWQVVQEMTVPIGWSADTFPLATKSRKPLELWHLAHAAGTTGGVAESQWTNASAFASACGEPLQRLKKGACASAVGVGASVGVGGKTQAGAVGQAKASGRGVGEDVVAGLQAARIKAKTSTVPSTNNCLYPLSGIVDSSIIGFWGWLGLLQNQK